MTRCNEILPGEGGVTGSKPPAPEEDKQPHFSKRCTYPLGKSHCPANGFCDICQWVSFTHCPASIPRVLPGQPALFK